MSRKGRSLYEAFSALITLISPNVLVFGHVLDVGAALGKILGTDLTNVRPNSVVNLEVHLKARFVHEALAAYIAEEWFFPRMDSFMIDQVVLLEERFRTVSASILLVRVVRFQMVLILGGTGERGLTLVTLVTADRVNRLLVPP